MTDYFEVLERDGAARLAELRLEEPIATPALVDEVLVDAGSLWTAQRTVPEGDLGRLTVLPHRAFPAGTDEEVAAAFAVDYPDAGYPSAAVVSTDTAADYGADAYVFSAVQGVVGHASAFAEAVVAVRGAIPDDTGLYLPGVATPRNAAVLAYAGVDLFDADRTAVAGTQGRYLTTDGEYALADLRDLDALPCSCEVCLGTDPDALDREDCAAHNEHALRAELARVRQRIRAGRLRDYVEGQARHDQWLTAAVREFDQQWGYLEERTPLVRTAEMAAASEDTLQRVEIRRFADRVTSRYHNRFSNPLVLVPCSARKPYSESNSHEQFHDAIQFRGHKVSVTSPIGVVPQELECTYPAQHYDAVVTGRWTEGEKTFVAEVLARYLERNDYPRILAHVPPEYRPVVERAIEDAGVEVPVEFTVEEHPTTTDSIATLMATLSDELKYGKRERQHNTLRAIADYQFGARAGDVLFPDLQVESRYPKLRAHDGDGEQLAAMVPQYGTLSLTLAGARRWVDADVATKRVAIDDFAPHGSVLAPGVHEADPSIRVGDEVVVDGPSAFAVGRARMHGRAMADSSRGVAVQVRHVEER